MKVWKKKIHKEDGDTLALSLFKEGSTDTRIYSDEDIDIPSNKAIPMLVTLLMTPCAGNQGCHAACSNVCNPLDSLVNRMKATFCSSNRN